MNNRFDSRTGGFQNRPSFSSGQPSYDLLATMGKIGGDDSGFIEDVRQFAEQSRITTNQLRNFYDMIVGINSGDLTDSKKKLVKLIKRREIHRFDKVYNKR